MARTIPDLRKILHSEGVFRRRGVLSSDFFGFRHKSVTAQERNGEYQEEDEPSHNILLASAIVASVVANRSTARTGLAQQLKSLMRSLVHRRSSCDEAFLAFIPNRTLDENWVLQDSEQSD